MRSRDLAEEQRRRECERNRKGKRRSKSGGARAERAERGGQERKTGRGCLAVCREDRDARDQEEEAKGERK